MKPRLLSALLLLLPIAAIPASLFAATPDSAAPVVINGRNPLDGPFLGFGAEWDSMAYRHYKMNDEDFSLIRSRLEWMKMPVVRTMMLSNWCYFGEDRYDFESSAMQMLYRQLDICEELGIKVLLTDWGLNDTWMKTPGLSGVSDPKYAEIIGAYLDHLLNVKKYTCIQQFIFMNEPEWMGYTKSTGLNNTQARDTWHQGFKNVISVLEKRGLRNRLMISGPDQSGNQYDWLKHMLLNAPGELDAYEIHLYANQRRQHPTIRESADKGFVRDYLREVWSMVRQNDPDKSKPLILGEAGFAVFPPDVPQGEQFSGRNNALHQDWQYGLYMTQYAIQSVEAGTWSVLAWMLDDSSHFNFTWGMWGNKTDGSRPKPWFYTWALLTRAFPPDSTFSLLKGLPAGVEGIAARLPAAKDTPSAGWSVVLTNTADTPATVNLSLPEGSSASLARYLYAEGSAKTDANGFPSPVETITASVGEPLPIELPARSVTFFIPASLSASK
ncbi:cellulase family glycosylhydrolase [Rariglobus hedericola]|uniref:Cellulase family glycosylhydrolase n=1 Tax=Rariglobus hedericola TaxID=2597822 RepID=A0A556QPH8_9BACT|nr:cellulase family glycosylhydrolase [Rariglobus hedericola]TSJ78545.1 cellulase family glycosylhydrolase [Rariglobus hedericola]